MLKPSFEQQKKTIFAKNECLKKTKIDIIQQPLAIEPSNFAEVLVTLMLSYGEKMKKKNIYIYVCLSGI